MKKLVDLNVNNMSTFANLEEHIQRISETEEFRNALSFFTSYPEDSLLSDNARAFLYQLIRAILPNKVLEIGCHLAGTSEVLARALWANNKGHLITIDPFVRENGVQEIINKWPKELQKRVILHPVNSASYFTTSEDILNPEEHGFPPNFDLIFIDGNHEYGYVLFDLIMSAQHCASGGVIVLDNADLPGVFWALKNFLVMNKGWRVLGNPIEKHSDKNPFETIYASYDNQFILFRPHFFAIDQVPVSFKSSIFYEPGIKGYEFDFLPDHSEGTLHTTIFFRSFYNQPDMGNPEERKIIKSIHLEENQNKAIMRIDPLISYENPDKSYRRSEIFLVWQSHIGNRPLFLKKIPEPTLIDNYKTGHPRFEHLAGKDISFLMFSHLGGLDLNLYEYGINFFVKPEFKRDLTSLLNALREAKEEELIQKIVKLDDVYEKAVYDSEFPAVENTSIDLHGIFVGTGWGSAEQDIHGTKWRWLGPEGMSRLYLRLKMDHSYLLKSLIFAAKGNSQERFNVYVNDNLAQHQKIVTEENRQVFHNCIIPKEAINQNRGWIKITYKVENPVEDSYQMTENMPFRPAEVALTLIRCNSYI